MVDTGGPAEASSSSFRITIISVMILTGAINTLAYKFQNKQFVYEGPYYKYFFHPYMQATTMFFGQMLAIFVFLFSRRRNPEAYKMRMLEARSRGKQLNMNKMLLFVPAFCDFVSSTLHYIALNFISGSIYLMLRGGTIVTTFLFSCIFLKQKIQRHQVLGSGLALVGVVVVGISNLMYSGSSNDGDFVTQLIGYILVIVSLFFNGFFFVYEQKLLSKYHLEPLEVVGYEGIFGLVLYSIVVLILNFIPCSFGLSACVISPEGNSYLQQPLQYFRQAAHSPPLLLFCILGVFSIATFNISGVTVTKHINALARSIGQVTRTVIVWTVGIIVTVTAGHNYPNFKWEIVETGAILLQLLGFGVLIGGNLVYNRIIKLRCLEARQGLEQTQSLLSATNGEREQ